MSGERASVALILRVVKVIQLLFSLIKWLLRFHFIERKTHLSLKLIKCFLGFFVCFFFLFVCFLFCSAFFFIMADIGQSL